MHPSDAALEVRDLRYRWTPGGPRILDIETLSIARGERIFIQGPSGSGKSTLLSLLGGVATPEPGAGAIRLLGQPLHTLRHARRDALRADHVGFIFQLFNLIPYLDALANVTLPCRFSRVRRQRAQAMGGVDAEARRLLDHLGLSDPALQRRLPGALSVGQQQRAAAARALLGAPEIVIADEPTSALDADLKEVFLRLLLAECDARGTTLVFVSHDGTFAHLFDRTVDLTALNRAGPVTSTGSP